MNQRLMLLLVAMLLAMTAIGCQQPAAEPPSKPKPAHSSMLSRQDLDQLISKQPHKETQVEGTIISGVLPHHLLAAPQITEILMALGKHQPPIIVLIGPNHDNEGGRVISGLYDWQTPEGRMVTETKAVETLLKSGLAIRDEKVLATEHSITGLVPLLHHYIPEAHLVPIIVQHGVTLKEVDAVLRALEPYLQNGAVVLSSVDFSHYLTRTEAQEKDRMTLHYMQKYDYTNIFRLNNDYLDSPASLAFAFRRAEGQGINNFEVMANTNSGIILGNDNIQTTSYFTLIFAK